METRGTGLGESLHTAVDSGFMNDCMVLGIMLDKCNPAQHMQTVREAKSVQDNLLAD